VALKNAVQPALAKNHARME